MKQVSSGLAVLGAVYAEKLFEQAGVKVQSVHVYPAHVHRPGFLRVEVCTADGRYHWHDFGPSIELADAIQMVVGQHKATGQGTDDSPAA